MGTLLELSQQGDVGTMDDAAVRRDLRLMTPQQLYLLWERQQWQSQAIDLERDRRDWQALDRDAREEALWTLSSFYIAEERVTTEFSGLVMAADDLEEEAYLTTQQVDEARHVQFFDRFWREVAGAGGDYIEERLATVREHTNDPFTQLFDVTLVDAGRRLIAEPRDVEAKVDFVTTYHMVAEGTLALTGQHFITGAFEERGILPGFVEGFRNIARDEHRHVAYGTWFLQQKASDPKLAERIEARLEELLPIAAGVLYPPGVELGADYTYFGRTSAEINDFAFKALTRRLKAIGIVLGAAA